MSANRQIEETVTEGGSSQAVGQNATTTEALTKDGFKSLMEAIRQSNALPTGTNYNFYNTHESFTKIMNEESQRVLQLMNNVLRHYDVEGNIKNRSLDEKTELLVDANDTILEKVANGIDEMNGIKKDVVEPVIIQTVSAQLPINGSWNAINRATFYVGSSIKAGTLDKSSQQSIRLVTAKNIIRPQKFFKDKIDNSSGPWEPRIKDKPNSLKPLALFLEETENGVEFTHPYEFELDKFKPAPEQLSFVDPVLPKIVAETPLVEVETEEQLNTLLEDLRKYKEFAVDLEHHSYRSFLGITCLMQISTYDTDYLIDTLALRDKLCILNEVFTNASIVKIFHGADMDVKWLQRDLSLYIVNMFDTHQAAKLLEYSGLSLSFLLHKFCGFKPNKHFQLADWRMRPLPDELKMYAREDTHYLIYIYHLLRNELLKKAHGDDKLLKAAIERSTDICKTRFFKPILKDDSHLEFYRKCKRLFNNRQLYALKELYRWRDQLSRQEDESTGYVLPNHMLLQISEILPREMQGILACCNPIPTLVRSNLLELHQIILRARDQPLEKPILKEEIRARGSTKQLTKINIDSPLHCPHDLTGAQEAQDNLPTLLGSNQSRIIEMVTNIEKKKPSLSLFGSDEDSVAKVNKVLASKLNKVKFLGPYERYKRVKQFVQAEEEKIAAEKEKEKENEQRQETGMDERSIEDRIASLHQHFVQEVQANPQNVPIPPAQDDLRDLLSRGGTKKRKHEELDEAYHPTYEIPDNTLHTPLPLEPKRSKNFYKNQRRKLRRQATLAAAAEDEVKAKKQKMDGDVTFVGETNGGDGADCGEGSRTKREADDEDDVVFVGENKKARKKKKKWFGNKDKKLQLKQEVKPFDYSSVDFKQFQGGAKAASQGEKGGTPSKKKAKNKNWRGGNNRYHTFGTPKKGKGHA